MDSITCYANSLADVTLLGLMEVVPKRWVLFTLKVHSDVTLFYVSITPCR